MTLLDRSFNESVLSFPLVSMYGVLFLKDRNKLIQIVKWSGKLTGESKLLQRITSSILSENSPLLEGEFQLLPSGQREKCRTKCYSNSFVPAEQVIRVLPAAVAHFYEFQNILCAVDLFLLKPHNLHLLFPILQNPQLSFTIQQVKHLSTHTCKS